MGGYFSSVDLEMGFRVHLQGVSMSTWGGGGCVRLREVSVSGSSAVTTRIKNKILGSKQLSSTIEAALK